MAGSVEQLNRSRKPWQKMNDMAVNLTRFKSSRPSFQSWKVHKAAGYQGREAAFADVQTQAASLKM